MPPFRPRHLLPRLLFTAFGFAVSASALQSQELKITRAAFNPQNLFEVEANVPAGSHYAVLEVMQQPPATGWRSVIAGGIDGRAAKVTFRLPRSAASAVARVKTGTSPTVPAAELTDAGLYTVNYGGGDTTRLQAKLDMLNGADEKFASVSTLPRPQLQAAMIAWAKSFPIVEDAAVAPTTDNVSIRFTDGTYAVLLNEKRTDGNVPPNLVPQGRRIPAPEEEEEEWLTPPAAAHVAARGPGVQGVGAQGAEAPPVNSPTQGSVPANRRAVCMFSLESWFPSSTSKVAGWLNDANYVTEEYPRTPVNYLMWLSFTGNELGVLFWQAHAYTYLKKDGTEQGAIVTGQFAYKDQNDAWDYQELIDKGELTLAKDQARNDPPIYAVTPAFIRKYFRFAPHSLVMLDACYGAHPLIAGAFIDAGAGAVGSWDHESGKQSATCMLKVFDRMLGSNKEAPISFPPERPFALPIIRQWMEMFSYDFDPSPKYANQTTDNARLIWHLHKATPALILRPAVMRILHEFVGIDEPFTKYLIEGDFGYDPGPSKRQVLWGGQPMNVLHWTKDGGIVIRPPLSPPAGNIQVVIQHHWKSNETPMTEWTVPFTAVYTSLGSLQYTVPMNAKFRADVHGSRGMPEMVPQYLPTMFTTLGDSTGQVTASGTWQPDKDTVVVWSGGTPLHSVDPAVPFEVTPPGDTIECSGAINPLTGTVDMFQLISRGHFTESVTDEPDKTVGGAVHFPANLIRPRINTGSYAFMGDSYAYPSGGAGTGKVSWPTTLPKMAPTAETVR